MVKVLKSNTDSDTSSEVKSATSKGASANDSMSANDNMGADNSKNTVEVESKDDRKARLKHLIKRLPNLPGVYKMLGKNGDILYVGKAKSLKSRVNSYFAKTIDHPLGLTA